MQDILSRLHALHRPRLLMRAARIGAENYRRSVLLCRLLECVALPRSGSALLQLMEIEADLNAQRKMADAGYSLIHHVEVLIAMIGEARFLRTAPELVT